MSNWARISKDSYAHCWMTNALAPDYRKSLCGMMYHVERLAAEDPRIRRCKQCTHSVRLRMGKGADHG